VLRETLRNTPTISLISIAPIEDEVLGGKYRVEANQPIILLLAKSQLDPAVFGDDVLEFKPERMYGENFDRLMREYPSSWKPFGNGMRGCIGRPFAWQEALMVMAMLFQNFNFIAHDPDYVLGIKQTLTIKPKDFYMRAVLRDGLTPSILEHRLAGTIPPPTAPSSKSEPGPTTDASDGKKINIYYGSNTGTCEALSQRLASSAAGHGFKIGVIDVMDAAVQSLEKDVPSIFITASYEGQPPDNARLFVGWLENLKGKEMENLPFAVFGCGTSHSFSLTHDQHLTSTYREP
jgi:cytochrome P450 / NADPH-cytochrome P450 reductase